MLFDIGPDKRFYGIYRALVVDNNDPDGAGRLTLKVPQVLGDATTTWAWPITGIPAHVKTPFGAFSDYTTQSIASTTAAYVMKLGTVDAASDISIVDGTKITFNYSGVYNFQWSGQFQNTDTQLHDAFVWIRINGVDVPGSTGRISIPNSHGGTDGHTLVGWNFVLEFQAGDYLELVWAADNTAVSLVTYPATTSPVKPGTAGLVVTVTLSGGYRPNPDDVVWAMFEGGDPNFPVWIGAY